MWFTAAVSRVWTLQTVPCTSSGRWKIVMKNGRLPVRKAQIKLWKRLDEGRSGRTTTVHLMSCCKSLELQFNWVPSHLQNSDGRTKRQFQKNKHLYIHIHWLARIDGTYTGELSAAESSRHQRDADAASSSLNMSDLIAAVLRWGASSLAETSWTLGSGLDGFLYTSDWIKSSSPGHVTYEEGRSERRRRPRAAFSFSFFFF